MTDAPDDLSGDWIRIEGNEAYLSENAPEHIREFYDNNPDLADFVIKYGLAASATGVDEVPRLINADRLVEREHQMVDKAIEDSDIEAAQRHKSIADTIAQIRREYIEWLQERSK